MDFTAKPQNAPMFQTEEQWVEYLKKMPRQNPLPHPKDQYAIILVNETGEDEFIPVRFVYFGDDGYEWDIRGISICPFKLETKQTQRMKPHEGPGGVIIGDYYWEFDTPPFQDQELWRYIIQIQPVTPSEIVAYMLQKSLKIQKGWIH